MSFLARRLSRMPLITDATAAVVRSALVAAAIGILTLGLYRLPEIATTHGEIVIGILLSISVALQMFVAALFFPMGAPRT